jgi:hypothetical protein
MSLFLKFAITIVLVALFISGLLSVLSALFSRISSDPFPEVGDLSDDVLGDFHPDASPIGQVRDFPI